MDAERLEGFQRTKKMRDGTGETVKLPHNHAIEAAPVRLRHESVSA
jgi:hypothetical protein